VTVSFIEGRPAVWLRDPQLTLKTRGGGNLKKKGVNLKNNGVNTKNNGVNLKNKRGLTLKTKGLTLKTVGFALFPPVAPVATVATGVSPRLTLKTMEVTSDWKALDPLYCQPKKIRCFLRFPFLRTVVAFGAHPDPEDHLDAYVLHFLATSNWKTLDPLYCQQKMTRAFS